MKCLPRNTKHLNQIAGEMLLWGGKYGEPGIGARWEPSASTPRRRAIWVTLIRTSRFSYLTATYKYRPNQERVKSFRVLGVGKRKHEAYCIYDECFLGAPQQRRQEFLARYSRMPSRLTS